jgi:glycosyltransferase involved in cell wall biosynthesis
VAAFRPNVILGLHGFGLHGFGLRNPTAPQVLFPQDSHLFYPTRHYAGEGWLAKLNKLYNRRKLAGDLRRTALILCQTKVVEGRIRETFGYRGPAWVCGSAVAPGLVARASPQPPPELARLGERFKLLCLSKYSAHKNFEGILEACRLAGERLGDLAIVTTVGRDHHRGAPGFIDAIARFGLSQRVINVGGIAPQRVGDFYAHVDGFLMPSRLETFCLPYVEAMSFGLPILTSDLDFAHAVCGDAAAYFDAWDAGSMADALVRFQADAGLRQRLGQAGRARAATFFRTWDEIAAGTLERLQTIVAGGRP